MQSNTGAGVVSGLIAGVVFGVMMQMMKVPTPDGMEVPMMMMVAKVVRSDSLVAGWLFHLVVSALMGGGFGLLFGAKLQNLVGRGAIWGALYGVFWWVLAGQILMPVLLGMPAFSALRDPMMRPAAMGSFIGHLVFGSIIGVGVVLLLRRRVVRPVG
jgi:hypothetical protein